MKNTYAVVVSLLFTLCLLAGCSGAGSKSGGTTPTPIPTPTKAALRLGFHTGPGQVTSGSLDLQRNVTSAKANLSGPARFLATFLQLGVDTNADVTTASSISMSFSGFCSAFPPALSAGMPVKIFGLGSYHTACGGEEIDRQVPTALEGAPAVGDGNLSELHAYVQYHGADASSLEIRVYVNGVATALTCNLGTALKCADSTTLVPVHDGDMVTAIVIPDAAEATWLQTQSLVNLRVMIGKS